MNLPTSKATQRSIVIAALMTLLLTACQITVEPAAHGYFMRKGEQIVMITQRQKSEDEAKVRAAFDQFHAALNAIFAGDPEPMKAVWSHADDVTYLGPDDAYRIGGAEVLADWEAQAALKLGGRVEPDDVRITIRHALAVVRNRVQGAHIDADGNPLAVSLRATVIFRREAGARKVIGVHTHLLPNLAMDER